METRDILNYLGVKIGELTLPSSTSEQEWGAALSAYAQPPKSTRDIIIEKIKDYKRISVNLIDELKADNTLNGITVEQSDELFDLLQDVLVRLREGAFPTALYRLEQKQPQGFMTQELLDNWKNIIKNYL